MVTKIVYFDYASIILLVAILLTSLFKKLNKRKANILFLIVAIEVLLTAIIGSVTLNLDNLGSGNRTLKIVFHTLYLFFHNLTSVCYLLYLVSLTDTWHRIAIKKYTIALLTSPLILEICLLIYNLFNPILFCINENDVYTRNQCFFILYLFAFIYLTIGVYYIFHYKCLFDRKMLITVFMIYPVTILSVIFEAFNSEIVIEIFSNSICLMFVLINIQHPEELINVATGFANSNSFEIDVRKSFKNKKVFNMIMINITNYREIRNMLGYERRPKISSIIAKELEKINSELKLHAGLYYLKNGQFRLIIENRNFDKTGEAALLIQNYFNTPLFIDDFEINYVSNVCIIRIPSEISDYDSLMNFGNDLNDIKYYTRKVLFASNIFQNEYYAKIHDINQIIENAFVEGNFSIYYQPIFSIKEGKFTSAEALLRLKDKKYGFVSPDLFIRAAEKSGAIHKIGIYVLEEVCKFIISDEFKNLGLKYIEVNLSVIQCMQDNLSSLVLGILGKYGVSPDKINLEITETALSLSQEKFKDNLNNLVNSGLSISLDDFGSGYSNLQRISQIPFNIVKLDKSFIENSDSEKVTVILKNIINMVRSLNIEIVIEGVETSEVLELFKKLKVDYVQGYYFSRPLPQNEFIAFIKRKNEIL